jgi:hypothetical protein
MEFYLYWYERIERDKLDALARMLGLLWSKEELFAPAVRPDAGIKELAIPLSLIMRPDLTTELRKYISKVKDDTGKPIKELGTLSREEFIQYYKDHTSINTGV